MILFLLIIFTLLQVADFYSTYVILKNGGRETNKPIIWMINKFGVVKGLVIVKGVAICVVWIVAYYLRDLAILPYFLGLANTLYCYIVLKNIRQKSFKRGL